MAAVNKTGQRADSYQVDHEAIVRGDGTLVTKDVPGGTVLPKDIEYFTHECPECGTEGRYDDRGEIVCDDPECGVVISGDDGGNSDMILPEDSFNGRCGGEGDGFPALRDANQHPSHE